MIFHEKRESLHYFHFIKANSSLLGQNAENGSNEDVELIENGRFSTIKNGNW